MTILVKGRNGEHMRRVSRRAEPTLKEFIDEVRTKYPKKTIKEEICPHCAQNMTNNKKGKKKGKGC